MPSNELGGVTTKQSGVLAWISFRTAVRSSVNFKSRGRDMIIHIILLSRFLATMCEIRMFQSMGIARAPSSQITGGTSITSLRSLPTSFEALPAGPVQHMARLWRLQSEPPILDLNHSLWDYCQFQTARRLAAARLSLKHT